MPCHWQNVPGWGLVHFNMAKTPRRKCAHCACPDAKALCDWPVVKPTRFGSVEDLLDDDVLVQPHGWRARILSITLGPPAQRFSWQQGWYLRVLLLNRGGNTPPVEGRIELPFVVDSWLMTRLRVERAGTCDKPCCFRCRRSPAPNVDYCKDHWHLQAGEDLRIATGDRARLLERRAREQRSWFE